MQGEYRATLRELSINFVVIAISQVQELVGKGCLSRVVELSGRILTLVGVHTLNLLDLTLKPSSLSVLQVLHLFLEFARQELPHLFTVYPQNFDISLCNHRIGERILGIRTNLLTDPDDWGKCTQVIVNWL